MVAAGLLRGGDLILCREGIPVLLQREGGAVPILVRPDSGCVDSGCGDAYSPAAGAVISFSCQGSTPGSERTSGSLVDSAAGDFAATARCGLSRNAKKPTTAAKPSARAIAAMPKLQEGIPRDTASDLPHPQTTQPDAATRRTRPQPIQQDEPGSDRTPRHPDPIPLANAHAAILHTPKTRTPIPHPNQPPTKPDYVLRPQIIPGPSNKPSDRAPPPVIPAKAGIHGP